MLADTLTTNLFPERDGNILEALEIVGDAGDHVDPGVIAYVCACKPISEHPDLEPL